MVFLGLEKPVEYGSRQIFDPTMANMVLQSQRDYVNAMKEDYIRGQEELKEFNKNFGDFFSPIQKDMEWYDQNVTGATRNLINNLYAQGIDPLRSAEGRSLISRWVNTMPVGEINRRKQSAVTATEYLKKAAELEAEGRYDEAAEILHGRDFKNWDTGANGIWNYGSPMRMMTKDEIIEPIIKNLKPSFDAELTRKMNDGYDYETVNEDMIRQTINDNMEDIIRYGTPGYVYYKSALDRAGGDEELARKLVTDEFVNRGKDHLTTKREANPYALARYNNSLAMQRDAANNAAKAARAASRSSNGGSQNPLFSWYKSSYEDMLANLMSDDVNKYSAVDFNNPEMYQRANATIINNQAQFGQKFVGETSYPKIKAAYKKQYERPMDAATVVSWIGAGTVDENSKVSKISQDDISRFLTEDAVITNTAGYTKKDRSNKRDYNMKWSASVTEDELKGCNNIQDVINKYGAANTTVQPLGKAYGSVRKQTASAELYPKVKVTVNIGNGKTVSTECYYDAGIHSERYKGGAYTKDQNTVIDPNTGLTYQDLKMGNFYPNANDWVEWGPKGIRTNANLKAASTKARNADYDEFSEYYEED